MKVGIYSPYLDTAGGGEKYILTIAEYLSRGEEVNIFLDPHLAEIGVEKIKSKMQIMHGLDLNKVEFIKTPFGRGSSALNRFIFLQDYDWLFYLTDGSIFLSSAKNSVIHFQVPFENTVANTLWGKYKLSSWKMAIYNSYFTKEIVEKTWPIKGEVVYPPVSVASFAKGSLKKEKHILSVGRFFGYLKDKKHSELIKTFKKLVDEKHIDDWSLHLVGGAGEGDLDYIDELKKQAKGYKIHFYQNATLTELKELYGKASIYWHAAGFDETDPKKFEHFGITTVEAMAAGAVPVVINKGGLREIVDESSGFLWDLLEDLEKYTLKLIHEKSLLVKMSQTAETRAKLFDKQRFFESIEKIVYGRNH